MHMRAFYPIGGRFLRLIKPLKLREEWLDQAVVDYAFARIAACPKTDIAASRARVEREA